MSEVSRDQADAGLAHADAEGAEQANSEQVAAEVAKTVAYDEFQKVVGQRQAEKKRVRELEARLGEIEKAKAAEQGKYKELWAETDQKLKDFKQKWMRNEIDKAVISAASKHGCVDPSALLAVGREHIDLLEFDESTGSVDGAEAFVERVKEAKAYLFAPVKTPTVNPAVPGGGARELSQRQQTDFSKLSLQDLYRVAGSIGKE